MDGCVAQDRANDISGSRDPAFKDAPLLLQIFPEEIWELVFEYLSDSCDLENVCNASLFFRHLLTSKQTLFLFPKVWNLIDLKYHQRYSTNSVLNKREDFEDCWGPTDKYYKYCKGCKTHVPGWWVEATLKLRLVCRGWNSAVESFHQTKPTPLDSPSEKYPGEMARCTHRNPYLKFKSINFQRQEEFIRHFNPTHFSSTTAQNHFPSRTVSLNFNKCFSIREPRWNQNPLAKLFIEYGRHIWHLSLFTDTIYKHYSRIRDLLKWMPNLKQLQICSCDDYRQNRNDPLAGKLSSSPLPTLNLLRFLYVKGVPVVMVNQLLSRNNQLEILEVVGSKQELDLWTMQLPKVHDFSVELKTEFEVLSLKSDLVQWPLTKLCLQVEASMEWPVILKTLQDKWGDTLTSLVLKLPQTRRVRPLYTIIEESSKLKINFPRVTSLELVMPNLCSVDCILPMKDSIEFLKITVEYGAAENQKKMLSRVLESGQVIKLLSHSDRLWESNVWTLFPKLKRLQLREGFQKDHGLNGQSDRTCTREDWKKSNKKKTI